jgi:cytoskeleton protein RodZ
MQHNQRRLFRQKPDGDIDPAGEAGWFLQRERERRGETLDLVAERCAIHPHHLEAIEAGDLTRLPARIEALRMIGAYGAYLGFDPQPWYCITPSFCPSRAGSRRPPEPPRRSLLAAPPSSVFRSPGACARSAPVAASRRSWWPSGCSAPHCGACRRSATPPPCSRSPCRNPNVQQNQVVAAAPPGDTDTSAFFERMAETPVASITTVTESPLDDTAEADRAADGLPGLGDFISSQISAVDESAFEAERSTNPTGGRVYGSHNAEARLVLKARAPVWVRIEDTQGNVILTQTLLTGDSYRVPDRSDLVIIARDGGLLAVEIDGVDKGSLGTPGEILVGRPLDIQSLASNG